MDYSTQRSETGYIFVGNVSMLVVAGLLFFDVIQVERGAKYGTREAGQCLVDDVLKNVFVTI